MSPCVLRGGIAQRKPSRNLTGTPALLGQQVHKDGRTTEVGAVSHAAGAGHGGGKGFKVSEPDAEPRGAGPGGERWPPEERQVEAVLVSPTHPPPKHLSGNPALT